jgi:transposase
MLALQARGWGTKRIASELGCSRNTVKRWLSEGGWRSMSPVSRSKSLDGLEDWLSDRFRRHAGNADVVRQELLTEKGISVSLRTVERAVAPLRQAQQGSSVLCTEHLVRIACGIGHVFHV